VGLVPQTENYWEDALNLMSTGVAAMALWARWIMKKKIEVAESLTSPSLAYFFLKIFLGREPDEYEVYALDRVMLIHAENELNFSTCGLRFAASTGATFRDSIASACGILSGPLHGGASLEVMRIFDEIAAPSRVGSWLNSVLQRRERIFGFGHLLYKQGDPRAVLLKGLAERLAKDSGSHEIYDLAEKLSDEVFKAKQLRPNIDFYSAVIYKMLGIPQTLAPGIFGMSRMLGWVLHYDEQNRVKTMITPTARFVSK
jgi:citrate synthase